MIEAWTLLAAPVAALAAFGLGRRLGRDAIAAAEERARAVTTEATLAAEHAVQARTRAEAALVPLQARLDATDRALSASGAECKWLRSKITTLDHEANRWSEIAHDHRFERDNALATLGATYVRIGPRFVRWRPDGVYPALAAGPEATPAADMPLEPAQDALEGGVVAVGFPNNSGSSGAAQHPSETRARGQGPVLTTTCGCIRCHDEQAPVRASLPVDMRWTSFAQPGFRYMCDLCGNKRCPHHADHRFACTGSNDAGQVGVLVDPPSDHGRYAGLDRGEPTRQGDA